MRRPHRRAADPPEVDEWVDVGEQRMWVVGYTEGGAPYGLTEEEYQAVGGNDEPERLPWPNWADARDVVCEIVRQAGVVPNRSTIGRIRHIDDGLSNVVFGCTVRLHERETALIIKLPLPGAESDRDERLRMEAALLRYLNTQRLTFTIPRPIGEVETASGLAVVQSCVEGFPVDLRAHRFHGGKPWEFVDRVAAGIHAINPAPIGSNIPTHPTRLHHAVSFASTLQTLEEPEARDSEAWITEHLPPKAPASLLHGDLLGQNLLRPWDATGRVGVIDWAEARVGDPAYDLAIVTRGHRKPFTVADGLARLVDSYNRLAGSPLTVADVHVHELVLHAGFYRAAIREFGHGSPHAEEQRGVWRSVLRRVAQARA